MSDYIMDPGARLEVGPRGKLYETLGALTSVFTPGITYSVTPTVATVGQPPLTMPPNVVIGQPAGAYPPGTYPPGYVPPMDTGVGFLGPDTNLYLIAGAVGIAGFIMWRRRHAASSAPASNPARRRRRRR